MTAKLKVIPGFSIGVRENSAMRMMKLGRPICPNSKIEMELDRNGRLVPKERGPDVQNCQMEGRGWWDLCKERGHNPYFRTMTWYTPEDIIEEDDQGRLIKKGEQLIKHEVVAPNIAQVALALRINNGKGVQDAIEKKGYVRLNDIGYAEVCQFRNCQKPVGKGGSSRIYGNYCGQRHLALIAADAESIMLTQGALLPVDSKRAQRKRNAQLREVLIGAEQV